MRILFLSQWFPYPTSNGSKVRIFNLLAGLAERHEVSLLSFADRPDVDPAAPQLRAICADVQTVPSRPFRPTGLRARLGYFSVAPRSVVDTYSHEMASRIRQKLAERQYDLVIASQWGMAGYVDCFGNTPAMLEEAEVGVFYPGSVRRTSTVGHLRQNLTWLKHRRYMAGLLRRFAVCTVASARERTLLRDVTADYEAVEVVPNCIRVADYAGVDAPLRPEELVFTGSFRYAANHEAMVWFLQEVYPQIAAQVPHVHVTITGDHANLELPAAPNVTLTGLVDDVRPLVASAWASIAPLRTGGGTRVKILEAMALRTPVVATSKGAEGLDVAHDVHLLLGDTPQEFAAMVLRLMGDAALRERLATAAYDVVSRKYDWASVMPHFHELVERAAGMRARTTLTVAVPG